MEIGHLFFSTMFRIIQRVLAKIGIAMHNPFADECTQDFGCCCKRCGKYWLRISQNMLPLRLTKEYIPTHPIGTPGRKFKQIKKYYLFNFLILTKYER